MKIAFLADIHGNYFALNKVPTPLAIGPRSGGN